MFRSTSSRPSRAGPLCCSGPDRYRARKRTVSRGRDPAVHNGKDPSSRTRPARRQLGRTIRNSSPRSKRGHRPAGTIGSRGAAALLVASREKRSRSVLLRARAGGGQASGACIPLHGSGRSAVRKLSSEPGRGREWYATDSHRRFAGRIPCCPRSGCRKIAPTPNAGDRDGHTIERPAAPGPVRSFASSSAVAAGPGVATMCLGWGQGRAPSSRRVGLTSGRQPPLS